MLKKNHLLTSLLSVILVLIIIIVFGSILGLIQFEQIRTDFHGNYLILRFQNSNQKPYTALECQHSSKYFLISCGFSTVLENSTELRGGTKPNL